MSDTSTSAPRRIAPATPATPASPRRRRGRPAKLSREAIVAAALALLDREGADALTMRRLGGELGVEAMSLYRHVADRAALLEGLADQLSSEVERRAASVTGPTPCAAWPATCGRSRAATRQPSGWWRCAC